MFVYNAVGLNGFGGSSYIDSVILRDRDANTDWDAASDGTLEERTYYCQNWRHDVVALIDDAGAQVQQVRYSAYGVPFGLPAGDMDSDGDVDNDDDTDIASAISGPYDVRGDMDLDGVVDNADRTALQSRIGDSLGRGVLALPVDHSEGGGGNRKGYAGYEGDFSRDGFWHVRHRVLDCELGRWTRRDPLGYVDGVSLYPYARATPLVGVDPLGLGLVPYDLPQYCGPEIGPKFEQTMKSNCSSVCSWIDLDYATCLAHWVLKVAPRGEWDYKKYDYSVTCMDNYTEYECPSGDCKFSIQLCGTCLRKDVLGNIHYGYTGACLGLSEDVLLTGSLLEAGQSGIPDDACDIAAIKAGYRMKQRIMRRVIGALFGVPPLTLCDVIPSLSAECGMPLCSECPCNDL